MTVKEALRTASTFSWLSGVYELLSLQGLLDLVSIRPQPCGLLCRSAVRYIWDGCE